MISKSTSRYMCRSESRNLNRTDISKPIFTAALFTVAERWKESKWTDAEAETAVLWPPDSKNWLIWRDPDAGKGWRQEETGTTETEMVEWHHRLEGHEFEQALGIGNGQESLACCSPWSRKESDMTEGLNWTELKPALQPMLKELL